MMMQNKIISEIKEAGSITILPHIYADGDALGSSFALALALKKFDKKVSVYLEEEIPYIYNFLPGIELAAVYKGETVVSELVIALDTGDMERLGTRTDIFNKAKTTVNIDHHSTNSMFAQNNLVHTESSAVGEIIYQLIKMLGLELSQDISICLYTAISTDTGGFRYSNTTPVTHLIASDLINNGANVAEISQKVFETTSFEKVKLTGLAADSLLLFEGGKIAVITLSDEMMKASGADEEDCEGIVNLGRNIRGVEVAVMLRQKNGKETKVNLRSKNYIDVAAIAAKYSGGGHKRAAGCTVQGEVDAVCRRLLDDIRKALQV
jgi:phosphoesterase RecJ-like protein